MDLLEAIPEWPGIFYLHSGKQNPQRTTDSGSDNTSASPQDVLDILESESEAEAASSNIQRIVPDIIEILDSGSEAEGAPKLSRRRVPEIIDFLNSESEPEIGRVAKRLPVTAEELEGVLAGEQMDSENESGSAEGTPETGYFQETAAKTPSMIVVQDGADVRNNAPKITPVRRTVDKVYLNLLIDSEEEGASPFKDLEDMSGNTGIGFDKVQDILDSDPVPAGHNLNVVQLVESIISRDSYPVNDKYFHPPPEARFVTNRNIYSREAPMSPVAPYESAITPSTLSWMQQDASQTSVPMQNL
ncbi:hypothetical protein BDZ97DRAFT_1925912 [Flammula alnicola]|nr:hypothetical protein BDZ97DRAFT_1925912 [Flammula alnicola]